MGNYNQTVRVPILLDAVAVDNGTDLIARIGQYGTFGYGVVRMNITGPPGVVNVYRGSISPQAKFSTVYSSGVADAQFTPPENIPQGNDLIVVWTNGTGNTARVQVTTDGGI